MSHFLQVIHLLCDYVNMSLLSKVTRPDGKTETAGMLVVDEPRAKQSDPTVLDLQLRTLTKQTTVKPVVRNPCN